LGMVVAASRGDGKLRPALCIMRIAAAAETTYADPSALLRLYVHQPGSTAMSARRARAKGALAVTHHGRVEIVNGICLAAFRKLITMEALSDAMASFAVPDTRTRGRRVPDRHSSRSRIES